MRTPTMLFRRVRECLPLMFVLYALTAHLLADTPPADEGPAPASTASRSVLSGESESGFGLSLEGTYMYGRVDGYLQTPCGGQPGTTSERRPTLDELGINYASIYDAALTLSLGRKEVFIGEQLIGLSSHATLQETLVSQNVTFPAGAEVDARVDLDTYRVGYRYWFLFDIDDRAGDDLAIAPSIGVGFFSFSYKLDGPGPDDVSRSYIKPTPLVGLDAEWAITNRVGLVGGVLCSIPVSDTPFILTTRVAARYRLINARSVKIDTLLGVGFEHLHCDDAGKQETPNDINVDLSPLLILGLKVEF